MIFFKSVVDSKTGSTIYFEAIENDELCGKCKLVINGNRADVSEIKCDNISQYIVEGLIKSAFNYACLKNCYMGYCQSDDFSFLLDRMNFIKADGVYYNDIPSILQGNCCKKQG